MADGTGEGAHAQLSAGGLLRDDTLVPGVLAGGGESVTERGAAVVHHAGVFDVAVLAAVRLLTVADFPVVDGRDVAVLGLFFLAHLGLYAAAVGWLAGRVDTVVEEPRDAGGAALYELHEARPAVFHEADDLVQRLAVAALDGIVGVGGVCGDVQRGVGIADGDAAAADGRGFAGAGGGDGAAGDVDGDSALLFAVSVAAAADARAAVFAARGLGDGAALDIDLGLAGDVGAGADARSGGAAGGGNFFCALDEDGGVALGVAAAANACAAMGGITAAGGLNGHAVAESDAGVAGGVAARTDARAALVAVAAARGLNSAAGNINGGLSGRRGTGTDACAVAYIPDVDKALGCDIAVGDVDVGVALGAFAAADAGTIITRSLDFAAIDLDVRGVGRIAAAADGCTGVAGGCDVAVSDTDNGLEGVRRTRRRTVEVSFTAAADGCAAAADGLYRAAFYRDVGVALGAFAAADASARVISGINGGRQRAHRRIADGDVSLAGGVTTAADACTVVGKSTFDTLFGSCIVDVDGRLAGGGFARTDGCAAAAIRVHERIPGDVDFGLAGRASAAADACTAARTLGIFNGAAGDGDGGVAGGSHAAADACAAIAAGGIPDGAAGDGDLGSAGGCLAHADTRAAVAAVGAAAGGLMYIAAGDDEAFAAVDAAAASAAFGAAAGGLLYPAAGDVQGAVAVDAVARLAAFGCAAGVVLAGAGGVAADGFFDDGTGKDLHGLAKDAFAAALAVAALRGSDGVELRGSGGAAGDGELTVTADAVAADASGRIAALGARDGSAVGDGEVVLAVDAVAADAFAGGVGAVAGIAADGFLNGTGKDFHGLAKDSAAAGGIAVAALRGSDGAAGDGERTAVDSAAAGGIAVAALRGSDGAAGDGELAVAADAVAAVEGAGVLIAAAAGSVRDGGAGFNGEVAFAVDAVAGVTVSGVTVAAAADGVVNGGSGRNGESLVAVNAVAGVVEGAIALAALRFFNVATLNRDGNILATAAAADAVAEVATHGLLDGAVLDGDCGLAGAFLTAADAGTTAAALGGDVAACYLNGAGTIAVARADTSSATAACGLQAAGVVALVCSGCDGQFAGVNRITVVILALFVVLEAGMFAAAGEGIVALERDRRVARALDAEGGVTIGRIFLVAGIDVDIVQRHVEGVVIACGLVDDFDDVVGDVFGCVLEVFRSTLQDRGRFVPGLFVVIVVGDLEGCAGVRELAFGRREAALRAFRAFRAFGRGLAAGGGSAARRAGGAALRAFALRVRASRAGVLAAGLVLFRGISLVFLAAGSVVRLVLAFFAAGSVVRLVLVFLAAGGVAGLVFVFLVAVVRRHVALGGAEVDHVFVFAVAVF